MFQAVAEAMRFGRAWCAVLAAAWVFGTGGGVAAQTSATDSPLGLWRTIDDKTGKPRSVVRIYEENGRLFGRIVRGFDARENERRCTLCSDERRDQLLRGLLIIRNFKPDGAEYVDGDILDPDNGKTYSARMKLEEGGRKLAVRGFVGISLFGRSQVWEREP